MVTNTVEDGKRKCFQYRPDDTQNTSQFGDINISMIRQEMYADFVTRELQCTKVNRKDVHTVYHCHFTA
ncbi:hypothetical protein DPMN_146042 [Dreissena polymorpha]|uniref:Tyrosine-protein phosphatase domain-containing protein n=1 Tax=Dreissena polymorpha TaxID=45954 RepID=A0A9D4IY29_DREPO|nr:hypothetical protein DPMN_146042 [Dreissena polymorpha]